MIGCSRGRGAVSTGLWLALAIAVHAQDSIVVFNELMYHPPDDTPELEWVELLNQLSYDMDISGWRLSGGIDYTFPRGTTIPADGFVVVARDPAAVATTLGVTNALGPFSGRLGNGGEPVRLKNNSGRLMDKVEYGDGGGWPVAADGSGCSLAKLSPYSASAPAANWWYSAQLNGTPGRANFPGVGEPLDVPLIDADAAWAYNDQGTNLDASWTTPSFGDTSWSNGQAFFNSELTGGGGDLVTRRLVQRYRAESITGLADNGIVTDWSDNALADGVAQDAEASGDPRFFGNIVGGRAVVRFDGDTDELRANAPPGIGATDGFAYFIVLRANATPDSGAVTDGAGDYIFDRDVSTSDPPLVSLKAVGGRYGFQTRYDNGAGIGGPVSSTAISQSRFQLVTVRRNRTAARFEIWVDGTLEDSTADSGGALTPQPINIGCHATATTAGFIGDIAEVLIYADELTDEEFQATGAFLASTYGLTTAFDGTVGRTPLATDTTTAYFRTPFVFSGNPAYATLSLRTWLADGAVFYLNGAELHRENMPAGAIAVDTPALSGVSNPLTPVSIALDAGGLVAGTNVLAVEVHKAADGTNGLFFGATLDASETLPDPRNEARLVISEVAGATNAAWWVELRNIGDTPLDLAGYVLRANGDPAREYVLPAGTLNPGGYLLLTAAQLGFSGADEEPLFLYRPGRLAVDDARVVKNRLRGRCDALDGQWLHPTDATPGTSNRFDLTTDIVINEIMYHHQATNDGVTVSDSAEEWIELFNRGTGTVDLSAWKFTGAIDFDFPAGTALAAGAYLVVARDATAMLATYPTIGCIGDVSGRFTEADDALVLEDAAGNPADTVHYYHGGRWPPFADGGGSSLELRDPFADNAVPEAWAGSDESGRATWRTYSFRAVAQASSVGPDSQWREFVFGLLDSGTVLLDDISIVEDPDGTAVQLIDNGSFSSELNGWRVIGNHRHSEVVPDPDNFRNPVLRLAATGPTEHMHNHVETTLAGGRQVTNGKTYAVSFRARWVEGSRLLNTRLYFNRLARTFVLDVPMTNGTPGEGNSTRVANFGPTYVGFGHTPAVPAAGEPVTVSVRAGDADGVSGVTVWYSVAGSAWQNVAMTNARADRYSAELPGQAAGTVVQFYVEGTDALGAATTFPRTGAASRALYKVDDGQASDTLHTLRVLMTAADADFMDTDIQLMSNEALGATVIFNEHDIYYDVGVRYKSSERGRVSDLRVGFKLDFHPEQPFLGIHEDIAIDRSAGQVIGQREMLINQVMNHGGGVLSKYTDLIKIVTPNPEHTSTAEMQLARFGDVFLDAQFDNGGAGTVFEYELIYYPKTANAQGYKLPVPDGVVGTAINDKGDDKESYRWPFLIKNRRARDDYSHFIAFCKVFGLSGDAFNAQVGNVADVDEWLRYMAYAVADGHGDSYPSGSNQHNTMFYVRPEDGRVLFFPHDMDYSYSTTRALVPTTDLQKLISTPEREHLYFGHMLDVLTTAYNAAYMQNWTDRFGALLPGQDFAGYLSFIGTRHDYLTDQLASRVARAYPFAVTTGSGSVTSDFVVVQGAAWLDVKDVCLGDSDKPLPLSWTATGSGTTRSYEWQTAVALEPGSNTLTFVGYDFQGAPVASNTIVIVSTATERPLRDHLRITELMAAPAGGNDYEFIEFHNTGTEPLPLGNVSIVDGVTFSFAGSPVASLAPGGYCVVVKNPAAFASRYDTNGMAIAGIYSGKLADEGESVRVLGAYGADVLHFTYSDGRGWPPAASGAGHSLVPSASAVAAEEDGSLDYGGNWRASTWIGGSPGAADPAPPEGPVLNELVAHTDYANPALPEYDSNDQVELYNPADVPSTLADCYLSDDRKSLAKWAVPATNLAGHAFVSYDEVSGFHHPITNGFGLDKAGEELLLSYLPAGGDGRVLDAITFKGQLNGSSLGRYVDGGGAWYAMATSAGSANRVPGLRVVVTELMYHPREVDGDPDAASRDEFLELHNPTSAAVDLFNITGGWRVAGGIDYVFPTGTSLAPGAYLVVVSFDPTNSVMVNGFLNTYGLPPGAITFAGPYSGQLSDGGERVALEFPQEPDLPDDPVSWGIVDEVIYFDREPWTRDADGTGRSLQRKHTRWSGNDPANWYAPAAPTPGRGGAAYGPAEVPDWWLSAIDEAWAADPETHVMDDPDGDGYATWQEYLLGTDPRTAESTLHMRIRPAADGVEILFDTHAAGWEYNGLLRHYSLKARGSLTQGEYAPVNGFDDWTAEDGTRVLAIPTQNGDATGRFFTVGATLRAP